MTTSTRPSDGTSGLKQRLTAALHWSNHPAARPSPGVTADGVGPDEGYLRVIYQSLAVFRFVSFAMGAGLVVVLNPSEEQPVTLVLVIVMVGLYNIFRVIWHFDPPRSGPAVQWVLLAIDTSLSITVILLSDGLDSAFLMYSLSPILAASLLMNLRSALIIAGILIGSISGPHVASGLGVTEFPWVLSGNYLAFALLYSTVCLLIGYIPFVANLNLQRRVRAESLDAERLRLRREVHDNVAQTLAFLSLKVRRAEERSSEPKSVLSAGDVRDIGSAVERAYLAVRDYLDGTEGRGRCDSAKCPGRRD